MWQSPLSVKSFSVKTKKDNSIYAEHYVQSSVLSNLEYIKTHCYNLLGVQNTGKITYHLNLLHPTKVGVKIIFSFSFVSSYFHSLGLKRDHIWENSLFYFNRLTFQA